MHGVVQVGGRTGSRAYRFVGVQVHGRTGAINHNVSIVDWMDYVGTCYVL